MNPSQHSPVLFIVTKPSLQAKALVNILASALPVTVVLHNINQLTISLPAHALILFDLTATNAKLDGKWQQHLKRMTTPFKLLLIDYTIDEQPERIIEWPSVRGLFSLAEDHHSLIQGINEVLENKLHLSDVLNQRYQECHKYTQANNLLTEREKAILSVLRKGASNNQIADSLFISKFTVKAHLYNIFKKLEVKNRTQAVNWMNEHM